MTPFFRLDAPLEAPPIDRQTRSSALNGFRELVRRMGRSPIDMLNRHGIDISALDDSERFIDGQLLSELLESTSSLLNDSIFGLRLGQTQDTDVFGAVTALCRAAPTFREALNSFIDFIPVVHSPLAIMELVEGHETAELRWGIRTVLGPTVQANYKAALLNLKLLSQIGGPAFQPSYVNLAVDARSGDVSKIADLFGCVFRGRASVNAIGFPSWVLDRPVPTCNALVFRLVGGYLERVRNASRMSTVQLVEDFVQRSLATGHCSVEQCAKSLGMSVRTLQSTLEDHSTRYFEIVERQRLALAQHYIGEGRISLHEMAAMLGYSDQSTFGRAFKRWTGVTPNGYRRQVEH